MRLRRGVLSALMAPSGTSAAANPSFRSLGTAVHGIGDAVPGLPADREGNDVLLLFVESDNINWLTGQPIVPAAPSLWTAVPSAFTPAGAMPTTSGGATNGPRITIFWARSSDISGAPTITDTGDHTHAVIAAYKDCKTGSPFNTDATGNIATASTTCTLSTGITTTVNNCLIVIGLVTDRDGTGATFSSPTNANLTSLTERYDDCWTDGDGGGLGVFDGLMATAGATGTTTVTQGASNSYRWINVALQGA